MGLNLDFLTMVCKLQLIEDDESLSSDNKIIKAGVNILSYPITM